MALSGCVVTDEYPACARTSLISTIQCLLNDPALDTLTGLSLEFRRILRLPESEHLFIKCQIVNAELIVYIPVVFQ